MRDIVIKDPIFGTVYINEPLILDLLESETVKRLKNIHQSGATYLVRAGRDGNRYEHSVGVMLLIKLMGGSIEEQAAGLLHDISHTAFSHVIDQVFQNSKETFHEEYKNWFLKHSDIPKILKKYDIKVDYIFDERNWGILEQAQPDLCADRVDYTLRDLYNLKVISKEEINFFLKNLTVLDKKLVVSDIEAAVWFTKKFHYEVTNLFMSPIEIFANNHLASALRISLNEGVLTLDDMLLKDDFQILELLNSCNNQRVKTILKDLNFGLTVQLDDINFDYQGFSKARVVDPLVSKNNRLIFRCSEVSPTIKELHTDVKDKALKGISVKMCIASANTI